VPSIQPRRLDSLSSTVVGDVSGQVTYGSESSRHQTDETADHIRNELIEGSLEREYLRIDDSKLMPSLDQRPQNPALQHSYTSLGAYDGNAPTALPDHVVNNGSPTTVRTAMAETVSHGG